MLYIQERVAHTKRFVVLQSNLCMLARSSSRVNGGEGEVGERIMWPLCDHINEFDQSVTKCFVPISGGKSPVCLNKAFSCANELILFALPSLNRNKVIWLGIISQIGIALILCYGLGSVNALNFTPLR